MKTQIHVAASEIDNAIEIIGNVDSYLAASHLTNGFIENGCKQIIERMKGLQKLVEVSVPKELLKKHKEKQ